MDAFLSEDAAADWKSPFVADVVLVAGVTLLALSSRQRTLPPAFCTVTVAVTEPAPVSTMQEKLEPTRTTAEGHETVTGTPVCVWTPVLMACSTADASIGTPTVRATICPPAREATKHMH